MCVQLSVDEQTVQQSDAAEQAGGWTDFRTKWAIETRRRKPYYFFNTEEEGEDLIERTVSCDTWYPCLLHGFYIDGCSFHYAHI